MRTVTTILALLAAIATTARAQTADISVHDAAGPPHTEISVPVSIDITSHGPAAGVDAIDLNFTGSNPLLDIVRFDLNPALSLESNDWHLNSPDTGMFTLFNFGTSATGQFILGDLVTQSAFVGNYTLTLDLATSGNPTDVTGIDPSNPVNPIHFDLILSDGIVSVVPEPGSLALVAIGALAILRRKSAAR